MKKLITFIGIIVFTSFIFTSCGLKKNEYPPEVIQNFMNSCKESSGGEEETCSCLFEKIQENYTFEEFSILEVKMQAGQTPPEFLEFIGKARAECSKK